MPLGPCASQVTFNTDVNGDLPWSFKPVQKSVTVLAGQTSLAFFEVSAQRCARDAPANEGSMGSRVLPPRRFTHSLPPCAGDESQRGTHHRRCDVQRDTDAGWTRCPPRVADGLVT